ncbi:MAG: pentapeptide repeat-containing protein [Blastocatellia bacterium]
MTEGIKDTNTTSSFNSAIKMRLSDGQKRKKLLKGEPLEFDSSLGAALEPDNSNIALIVHSSWITDLLEKENRTTSKSISISNAIIMGPLDFRYAIFPYELYITDSRFTSEVDFSFATFACVASFEGSKFEKPVTFRAVHAESYFSISRCCFADDSLFLDLQIDENLYADSARFQFVDFTRARVSKAVFFRPYNTRYSKTFDKRKKSNPSHQEGELVEFAGDAFFDDIDFGGTIEFQGAQFRRQARFEGIHIGGSAFFYPYGKKNVCFEGEAMFSYAKIERSAYFGNAAFRGGASFEGIQVGGYAIWGSYIESTNDFQEAQEMRLSGLEEFDDTKDYDSSTSVLNRDSRMVQFDGKVDLTRARFKGPVSFKFAYFKQEAKFDGAESQGPVDFQGAVFEERVSFCEARFRSVFFNNVLVGKDSQTAKQFRKSVDLLGFTYDLINGNWLELLTEDNTARSRAITYYRQPYTQLEKVLRAMGHDREADKIYLARRKREFHLMCKQALGISKGEVLPIRQRIQALSSALFDLFQRLLFNYGIRPIRLLWFSLIVLLVGTYMFMQPEAVRHREKDERKPVETLSPSQAFGVSFRLFIPIVDLPTGQQWVPTDRPAPYISAANLSFAGYATLHRLAGIILVPLGIAALTGLMHRRQKS